MRFPWDKINIAKASDKSKGVKPNPLVLDEIGQYNPSMNRNWRQIPKLMEEELKYEVKSYPDGSKYAIVNRIDTKMLFRLNSYEDLWILNQIHDVVKHAGKYVTVTIPNLIDAQADRRFDKSKPHGLKLVCEFLNSMTSFSFRIFHPHNAEVVEALLDRVEIVDNWKFISQVITKLNMFWNGIGMNPNAPITLMSSDAGGFKPLMKLTDKLKWQGETFSASKSRAYVDGETKLVQMIDRQDFEGKDILIIDDICVYGGTFKGLSKMLKERNCGKLYLAVSHLTVQDLGEDPVTNYFEKVFTTNSKFDRYTMRGIDKEVIYPENLEIINLF